MNSHTAELLGGGLLQPLSWPLLRIQEPWLPEPPTCELLEVAHTPAAGILPYTEADETGRLFMRLVSTFQGIQLQDQTVEGMVADAADVALMLETWGIPAARWVAWTDSNWRTFAPEEMRGSRAPLRQFLSKNKLVKWRKELPTVTATFCTRQAYFAPEALKLLRRYEDMKYAILRVPPSGRRRLFDRYFRGYPRQRGLASAAHRQPERAPALSAQHRRTDRGGGVRLVSDKRRSRMQDGVGRRLFDESMAASVESMVLCYARRGLVIYHPNSLPTPVENLLLADGYKENVDDFSYTHSQPSHVAPSGPEQLRRLHMAIKACEGWTDSDRGRLMQLVASLSL